MRLTVQVAPGARRDRIVGWLDDALKVAVQAPPERGRANEAVAALLGEALGVEVRLLRGRSSRRKLFEIVGLDGAAVRARIAARVARP
ncbi:MAG: DUF167 domain-containing protein [Deltaproteobacteria bacterium]|nr:DUF167 domain-containing protein [Deltaproteobacteria bacterium]